MAEYTGSGLSLVFDGNTLDGEQKEFSIQTEIGIVDVSAGADTYRSYLTTMTDGTATLMLLRQTGEASVAAVGDEGNLVWGPEGNTAGQPRFTVNAIVTGYDEKYPYDGAVETTITFQFSGAVAEDTF